MRLSFIFTDKPIIIENKKSRKPGIRGSIKCEQCEGKWRIVDQCSAVVFLLSTAFPPLGTQVKIEERGRLVGLELEGTISAVWRVTFAVEATTTKSTRRCPSQTRGKTGQPNSCKNFKPRWENGMGADPKSAQRFSDSLGLSQKIIHGVHVLQQHTSRT